MSSPQAKTKRALGQITYEPDPVNFNSTLALNDTTIYEYDPYFTATLDSLDLDLSVTVGAKIVYNVLTSTLGEFFFFLRGFSRHKFYFSRPSLAKSSPWFFMPSCSERSLTAHDS